MNRTVSIFLLHFLAWCFVFLLGLIIVFYSTEHGSTGGLIATTAIFAIWLLIGFYAFYYKLIPDFLAKGNYRKFALYALLVILLVIPLDQFIWWGLFYYTVSQYEQVSFADFTTINLLLPYLGSVLGSIVSGGLGTFYRFGMDWFTNQQQKKELENKQLQSELQMLKSKLNPHLLFNTLNNIDALIYTSQDQASVALSTLSDILRYVVYETDQEKVPIRKEIANLEKYITLEKMRIIRPEAVEFDCQILGDVAIPPMLFFPFVENAFKHSNLNHPSDLLKISILEDQGKLTFHCANTINTNRPKQVDSGVGLDLAKKRLALVFPNTHQLAIHEHNQVFHVHLEIPLL